MGRARRGAAAAPAAADDGVPSSTAAAAASKKQPASSPAALQSLSVAGEAKAILSLATPVCLTYLIGSASQLVNVLLVGHVSATALASATLGSMYVNMLGSAVAYGFAQACDTLSSQAVGAKNYPRVGHISQRGIAIMLTLFIPVAFGLYYSDVVLTHLGQEQDVVVLSASYARVAMVGFPAMMVYEILKKHLQALAHMLPPLVLSLFAVCINALLGYVLVYRSSLGFLGAPVATVFSWWCLLISMMAYMRWHRAIRALFVFEWRCRVVRRDRAGSAFGHRRLPSDPQEEADAEPGDESSTLSSSHSSGEDGESDVEQALAVEPSPSPSPSPAAGTGMGKGIGATKEVELTTKRPSSFLPPTATPTHALDEANIDDVIDATWSEFSWRAAFSGWGEFISLGFPSACSLFVEWGAFEAQSIIAGWVGTKALAAHSVMANTVGLSFMPALSIAVASSVRIGQALGDLRPSSAQRTSLVSVGIGLVYVVLNAVFIFSVRGVWGSVYSDDSDVINIVGALLPILALYSAFDGLQCVVGGTLRGIGRPGLAAGANVVAYILLALPIAYALAIHRGIGLVGVWAGNCIGVATGYIALFSITLRCINWQREAETAHARALQRLDRGGSHGDGGALDSDSSDSDDDEGTFSGSEAESGEQIQVGVEASAAHSDVAASSGPREGEAVTGGLQAASGKNGSLDDARSDGLAR